MRYFNYLTIAFSLIFFPLISKAAITIDSTSTAAVASTIDVTLSHIVLSNCADRVMLIGISTSDLTGRPIGSVTYNGTSTSLLIQKADPTGDGTEAAIYKLVNPDEGTHNIVVDRSGSADGIGVSGIVFCGVSTSSFAMATNTNIAVAVSDASAISAFFDTIAAAGVGTPAPAGSGQIIIGSGYHVASQQASGQSYKILETTSGTMSWTTGGIYGDLTGHAAVGLFAAASPPSPPSSSTEAELNTPEEVMTFLMNDMGYTILSAIILGLFIMIYNKG